VCCLSCLLPNSRPLGTVGGTSAMATMTVVSSNRQHVPARRHLQENVRTRAGVFLPPQCVKWSDAGTTESHVSLLVLVISMLDNHK
jgi:hypothetical protein